MFRGQSSPTGGLIDIGAFSDAKKRIVRLELLLRLKMNVIRGHQRKPAAVCERNHLRFDFGFDSCEWKAGTQMPLDFDIESAVENLGKLLQKDARLAHPPVQCQSADRTFRTSSQTDHS